MCESKKTLKNKLQVQRNKAKIKFRGTLDASHFTFACYLTYNSTGFT